MHLRPNLTVISGGLDEEETGQTAGAPEQEISVTPAARPVQLDFRPGVFLSPLPPCLHVERGEGGRNGFKGSYVDGTPGYFASYDCGGLGLPWHR